MRFDITQVIFVRSDFLPSGTWVYGYCDGHLTGEFYSHGRLPQEALDFIVGKKPYSFDDDHTTYECFYKWSDRL